MTVTLARTLAAALLCATALSPALADAPIRSVTLSSSGLSEISRSAQPTDGTVTLRARLDDIDDVLKSLVVLGHGLESVKLRLDGPAALEDFFATLPFSPLDLGRIENLLALLPGTRVSVQRASRGDRMPVVGRAMGVDPSGQCEKPVDCPPVLLVMGENGALTRIRLGDDVEVRLLDVGAQRDVERALDALATNAGQTGRDITLEIQTADNAGSATDGALYISYVLAAPVWKTAYRAVLTPAGTVSMQAWAVIENTSGEDWDDVALTLSSGSPRTLRASLFARTYAHREHAQADKSSPVPSAMFRSSRGQGMADGVMSLEAASIPPMAGGVAQVAADTEARESDVGASFTFADTVNLNAGEMISMLFLSEALKARAAARHVGGSHGRGARSPALVLDVVNDLPVRLPSGVATLYEAGTGFIGDTMIPDIAPGETRAVVFGEDRKTLVEEIRSETRRERWLRVVDGTAVLEDEDVRGIAYRVTAPRDVARTLIVDHPKSEDWNFSVLEGSADYDEILVDRSLRAQRFVLELEPGRDTVLRLQEVRPAYSRYLLADLTHDQILAWSGREMSEANRDFLQGLAGLKQDLTATDRSLRALDDRRERLISEQERARNMMGSMPDGTEAHERYLAQVLAAEEQLAAELSRRDALEIRRDTLRDQVGSLIRNYQGGR